MATKPPKQATINVVQNGWEVVFNRQSGLEHEIFVFATWDSLTTFLMEQLMWPEAGTE